MKIALDGFELGREAKGVGRVIQNLMLPLPDFLPEDKFLVCTKEDVGIPSSVRVEQRILPGRGGYLRWQNGVLYKTLKAADPDLLIASNYVLPLRCPWESILVMHDLSVIAHPEWYPRKYAFTRRYLFRRSLERAALIVVPSGFVGDEIRAFLKVTNDRIKHIGWGVEDSFRRVSDEQVGRWREGKGLAGKKVVGFLGSIFKRRHVPELIRAVGLLRSEFRDLVLHLVGRDFGGLGGEGAARSALPDWVLWEMSLPEEELSLYYSSIDAFAYLSEYEGFGLPPLEALACGTPSVLLDVSSLSEVFFRLAFMIDTPEPRVIAAALRMALTDRAKRDGILHEFARRKDMFSWKKAASELAASIRTMGPR